MDYQFQGLAICSYCVHVRFRVNDCQTNVHVPVGLGSILHITLK